MAKQYLPNPPELILLKALWEKGPMAIRMLHDECALDLAWSFSSTRKTLERMTAKGFLILHKPEKSVAQYTAKASKTTILANMTRDFTSRVLELKDPPPNTLFSSSKILNDDELEELEGLLGL